MAQQGVLGYVNSQGVLMESLYNTPLSLVVAIELMKQLNTRERRGQYSIRYVVIKL